MIYFSDLDRTIICSKKLINDDNRAICIEHIEDEEISYVSKEIIDNLLKLNQSKIFIPTTTRSLEQFKRIAFNNFGLDFKYAITSNGACILKDGKKLESWEKEISLIKERSTSMDTLIKAYEDNFSKDIESHITKFRIVEDNFFYIVLDKSITNIDFLSSFTSYLENNGWVFFKNCSKVYFLPKGMSKENAIQFLIKTELNSMPFNALGDSTMDAGMLQIANKAFIPKHGDIASTFEHTNLYVTESLGLDAVNEMLEIILNN